MTLSQDPAVHAGWMQEALREAEAAGLRGEVPVGAVVVRAGEAVARAGNRMRELCDPSAHAEMLALRAACRTLGRRLSGCVLYVTLEPCAMCAGFLAQLGLAAVVFGARDAQAGCCGSVYDLCEDPALPYAPTLACGGVLEERCAKLLEDFFKTRRKRDA